MLAIRSVLRDAMADFSILYWIRSLWSLIKFLRSNDSIRLFLRSPTIPELRGVLSSRNFLFLTEDFRFVDTDFFPSIVRDVMQSQKSETLIKDEQADDNIRSGKSWRWLRISGTNLKVVYGSRRDIILSGCSR
ncbi:hypothetical protein OPV22_030938 [Ensete ventricosum]|uniref:Uncharacterized protein n=1 Tax=Ensete ventricosum TaxID=4639 RepID=A0AAV8PK57_ENSVE|nr:hypothetical protein OPV22_030938 [Ensete ventricosum]